MASWPPDATLAPGLLGLPASEMWASLRLALAAPGLQPEPDGGAGLPPPLGAGLLHLLLAAPPPADCATSPLPLRALHRLHFAR